MVAAAYAAGVKHGLEAIGDLETQVISYAGEGGTYDIGLQAISGAAERNDDIIHFCGDNEAYMNTGVKRTGESSWGGRAKSRLRSTSRNVGHSVAGTCLAPNFPVPTTIAASSKPARGGAPCRPH